MSKLNTTDSERPEAIEAVLELEEALLQEFYWDYNAEGSNRLLATNMIAERSVDDEIQRLIGVDIALFLASILFIVVILTVAFVRGHDKATNNNCCIRSRTLVGISSIFVIIFSVMFAFGMMGHLGIPMNSICFMVCFIVAGVGVDGKFYLGSDSDVL